MGLLGNILEPNPQGGLLDLAMNLAVAGGSGAPTMAGLAQAGQATRQNMLQAREYQRRQELDAAQKKAIASFDDPELQRILQAVGPEGYTEILSTLLKGRMGFGTADVPADIQKYQFYKSLPDDKARQEFMSMMRAGQILDMGGFYAMRDPVSGQLIPLGAKGLDPGDEPSVRGAQTMASETAKARVEFDTAMGKKEIDANDSLALLGRARDALQDGPTGSGLGAARDVALGLFGITTNASDVAARLDIIAPILIGKVPRFEGPQSNADRQLYEAAAGRLNDRTLPVGTRLAALGEMERASKSNIETARRWRESMGTGGATSTPAPAGMPTLEQIRAERQRRQGAK